MTFFNPNHYEYDAESGHYISEKHRRIAEIINDYDSSLSLVWIPPSNRSAEDVQPFAILHSPPGGEPYFVRKVAEEDVDERLIAWLWSNDQERNNPLAQLEKWDAAREALRLHEEAERKAEEYDIAQSILKSPLNTYHHNGKVYQ